METLFCFQDILFCFEFQGILKLTAVLLNDIKLSVGYNDVRKRNKIVVCSMLM